MNNQGNYHWYSIIPEAQLMIIKPKETNNTEITLASASNHSNKFFDSQKQDSDYSQKLSTENTLKPK
ncbi:hypothetical protein [uncultured Legionella sp.]|uniref:hypothetical protein n=1 Tax=uncultured Legionella sp. TaxID=210934 RepID=UPI0026184733|nr:hypothetical protein [uncultured Legionella sp.]